MKLHNDRPTFERIVIETSNYYGVPFSIVEKDYYVTIVLKELVKRIPNIIFKGGTSLSKCYRLINRFSEDIDLNIESEKHPTDSERKRLCNSIKDIINNLGFVLKNDDRVRSRNDFNRFEVDCSSIFDGDGIKTDLIIETAVFIRSYPCVEKRVNSYIYDYLLNKGYNQIIEEYNLEPFSISVQSLDRTFIDKIFAIADYYLSDRKTEHSRHLYDLYKIKENIEFNESFFKLFYRVREERRKHEFCYSAKDGVDIVGILFQAIASDYYKSDFDSVTKLLLFEDVDYSLIKRSLLEVVGVLKENLK